MPFSRSLWLAAGCYFLPALVGEDTFSLSGRVINTATHRPVPQARVFLIGPAQKTAVTNASGAFRFDHLPPAKYSLYPAKPSYRSAVSSPWAATLGPSQENLVLTLEPTGVLTGRLTDTDGSPLPGVTIAALQRKVDRGWPFWTRLRSVTTDDRGIYRLWDLEPGEFLLEARGWSAGTTMQGEERMSTVRADYGFLPVYTGGVERREDATLLRVSPGEEVKADFRLLLQPAVRIRGKVSQLRDDQSTRVELVDAREQVLATRATINSLTGEFVVYSVVPGHYRLRVTQGTGQEKRTAETDVEVGRQGLTDLRLVVHPPAVLQVKVRPFGEKGSRPTEQTDLDFLPGACRVALRNRYGELMAEGSNLEEGKDFSVGPVDPGEYRVDASCTSGFVSTMDYGGVNLGADGLLRVVAGEEPPRLTLDMQRNNGALLVKPEGLKGEQQVLVVPQFAVVQGVQTLRLQGTWGSELAPGNYLVYVVPPDFAYRDPQALVTLRNGKPVRIEAKETTLLELRDPPH